MEVAAFQRAWLAAHTVQVFEQRLLVLLAEQPQAACLQKLIEKGSISFAGNILTEFFNSLFCRLHSVNHPIT